MTHEQYPIQNANLHAYIDLMLEINDQDELDKILDEIYVTLHAVYDYHSGRIWWAEWDKCHERKTEYK